MRNPKSARLVVVRSADRRRTTRKSGVTNESPCRCSGPMPRRPPRQPPWWQVRYAHPCCRNRLRSKATRTSLLRHPIDISDCARCRWSFVPGGTAPPRAYRQIPVGFVNGATEARRPSEIGSGLITAARPTYWALVMSGSASMSRTQSGSYVFDGVVFSSRRPTDDHLLWQQPSRRSGSPPLAELSCPAVSACRRSVGETQWVWLLFGQAMPDPAQGSSFGG